MFDITFTFTLYVWYHFHLLSLVIMPSLINDRKKGQFKKVDKILKGKSEEVEIKEIHVWGQSILASLRFPLNDARYLDWTAGTEESLEKDAE